MDKVFAERLAVQIFPMGVDVVRMRRLVEGVRCVALQVRHAGLESGNGGLLRAQNDLVDLPLARRKLCRFAGSVRVMSEAYIEYSPATSITTTSPFVNRAGVIRIVQTVELKPAPTMGA